MSETRNIVFLGASYAGLGATHYFLKHVYPRLPTSSKITYQVVLVDPSSKWYARSAAPRAAGNAPLMPIDTVLFDIESGYKQYGDKVRFVQGKASTWDEKARTLIIQKADGATEVLDYWALVLATGSKSESPLFSLQGSDYTDVKDALLNLHRQLSTAKTIVIAGGGPAGVETAGELGDALNGAAGWFASRPAHPKAKITLITGASKLLPQLRQSIADKAETYLARVGVDVQYNTKVVGSKALPSGKTSVELQGGVRVEADIYIPASGSFPMSDYAPEALKDKRGYIITNESTLRVDAAGPLVYAMGDVASNTNNSIIEIMDSLPVLETNLQRDLLAAHSDAGAKPDGPDRKYVKNEKETQVVPVGLSKGVGAVFGWRLPSFLVWLFKGRNYMISKAYATVNGTAVLKESVWKQ